MSHRQRILLYTTVFFALLLRVIYLGKTPTGFTPDEASQGYSAYSLLKTGTDEWGTSWPITSFKSFLDYKAPLQTYLMIPSIAIFGLNEFSVRLPSALFGVLAIIGVYLLASTIFENKTVGLLASFILAISPWHFQFSRMALEANLISFFFPLGLYFFAEGLKKSKYLFYSAILWSVGLYSYHAFKIYLPLFLLAIILLFRHQLAVLPKKSIIKTIIFFLLIASPLIYQSIFGQASRRGVDLLVTNLDSNQSEQVHNAISYANYRTPNYLIEKVFHNKYTFAFDKFVENFTSYLSPSFWFTEGGRETTYSVIPGRGLLYFWQFPVIVFALYKLFQEKKYHQLKFIIPWLLLAAIPAAITKEGYRPNRAAAFATLFEIVSAYGLYLLFVREKYLKKYTILAVFVVAMSFIFYMEDYFSSSKTQFPNAMSYGWNKAVVAVNNLESKYDVVQIERGSQSQSFFAFYKPISPNDFQKATYDWDTTKVSYLDQIGEYKIGKYLFKDFSWPENRNNHTIYLASKFNTLPSDRHTIQVIYNQINKPVFEIFDFKK